MDKLLYLLVPVVLPVSVWGQECEEWLLQVDEPAMTRNSHEMVYDSRRGVMVMFGGKDSFPAGYNELRETREWDGATWTVRSTTGPSQRQWPAMSYDSRRGVAVLFGGVRAGAGAHLEFLGDTWEWDGQAWTLRSQVGPSPRFQAAMAFDSRRGVSVLFGGYSYNVYTDETWEWDGVAWTLRATGTPPQRLDPEIAFDSRRGVMVMVGSVQGSGSLDVVWEWSGTNWMGVYRPNGPPARWAHALAFDSARGVTVLFGGHYPAQSVGYNDLWEWDGDEWTELARPGPSARHDHAMSFDDGRHTLILHGGLVDERHNDVGDTWQLLTHCDEDGDGVGDGKDGCAASDLREAVVIDDCESGIENHLFEDGCTMLDRIIECEADARNHGDFVTCVGDLAHGWTGEGVIDTNQKGDIIHCAAQADAPLRRVQKMDRGHPTRPQAESLEPLSQP